MSRKKNKKRNNNGDEGREFRDKSKKNSSKRSSRHWRKRLLDEVRDGVIKTEDVEQFE